MSIGNKTSVVPYSESREAKKYLPALERLLDSASMEHVRSLLGRISERDRLAARLSLPYLYKLARIIPESRVFELLDGSLKARDPQAAQTAILLVSRIAGEFRDFPELAEKVTELAATNMGSNGDVLAAMNAKNMYHRLRRNAYVLDNWGTSLEAEPRSERLARLCETELPKLATWETDKELYSLDNDPPLIYTRNSPGFEVFNKESVKKRIMESCDDEALVERLFGALDGFESTFHLRGTLWNIQRMLRHMAVTGTSQAERKKLLNAVIGVINTFSPESEWTAKNGVWLMANVLSRTEDLDTTFLTYYMLNFYRETPEAVSVLANHIYANMRTILADGSADRFITSLIRSCDPEKAETLAMEGRTDESLFDDEEHSEHLMKSGRGKAST